MAASRALACPVNNEAALGLGSKQSIHSPAIAQADPAVRQAESWPAVVNTTYYCAQMEARGSLALHDLCVSKPFLRHGHVRDHFAGAPREHGPHDVDEHRSGCEAQLSRAGDRHAAVENLLDALRSLARGQARAVLFGLARPAGMAGDGLETRCVWSPELGLRGSVWQLVKETGLIQAVGDPHSPEDAAAAGGPPSAQSSPRRLV